MPNETIKPLAVSRDERFLQYIFYEIQNWNTQVIPSFQEDLKKCEEKYSFFKDDLLKKEGVSFLTESEKKFSFQDHPEAQNSLKPTYVLNESLKLSFIESLYLLEKLKKLEKLEKLENNDNIILNAESQTCNLEQLIKADRKVSIDAYCQNLESGLKLQKTMQKTMQETIDTVVQERKKLIQKLTFREIAKTCCGPLTFKDPLLSEIIDLKIRDGLWCVNTYKIKYIPFSNCKLLLDSVLESMTDTKSSNEILEKMTETFKSIKVMDFALDENQNVKFKIDPEDNQYFKFTIKKQEELQIKEEELQIKFVNRAPSLHEPRGEFLRSFLSEYIKRNQSKKDFHALTFLDAVLEMSITYDRFYELQKVCIPPAALITIKGVQENLNQEFETLKKEYPSLSFFFILSEEKLFFKQRNQDTLFSQTLKKPNLSEEPCSDYIEKIVEHNQVPWNINTYCIKKKAIFDPHTGVLPVKNILPIQNMLCESQEPIPFFKTFADESFNFGETFQTRYEKYKEQAKSLKISCDTIFITVIHCVSLLEHIQHVQECLENTKIHKPEQEENKILRHLQKMKEKCAQQIHSQRSKQDEITLTWNEILPLIGSVLDMAVFKEKDQTNQKKLASYHLDLVIALADENYKVMYVISQTLIQDPIIQNACKQRRNAVLDGVLHILKFIVACVSVLPTLGASAWYQPWRERLFCKTPTHTSTALKGISEMISPSKPHQ